MGFEYSALNEIKISFNTNGLRIHLFKRGPFFLMPRTRMHKKWQKTFCTFFNIPLRDSNINKWPAEMKSIGSWFRLKSITRRTRRDDSKERTRAQTFHSVLHFLSNDIDIVGIRNYVLDTRKSTYRITTKEKVRKSIKKERVMEKKLRKHTTIKRNGEKWK